MRRNLFNVLRELWRATRGTGGSYRRDLHYMRSPGPKWRAKQGVAFATVPVNSYRPIRRHISENRVSAERRRT